MTTTAALNADREVARVRYLKTPIGLAVFAIAALLMGFAFPRDGETTFRLSTGSDFIQLPALVVPTVGFVAAVAVLMVLMVFGALAFSFLHPRGKSPLWLVIVFVALALFAFLTWAAAGKTIPLPGLLIGALALSTPIIFGALGGVVSERVGVVNIAIEGQLLFGAFSAAVVSSVTGQPLLGLLAAMIAGMLVSLVLAVFAIRYIVEQVIVGVVLNVLVMGLTNFLYSTVLTANTAQFNSSVRFPSLEIPILSQIPIIGPVFFQQTIIVYLMYIAVFGVWFGLFKTRWGLRVRSVGEHPTAADTVGIDVNRTRFWNVLLAGAIAGMGGAYFTLDSVSAFGKEMTNGMGFIALAAVIFGRWHPIRATLAALLFGFATSLQSVLGIIGSPVPSEFMLMLPYLVTIFAVAGLVGQSRPPAADGKPYIKS